MATNGDHELAVDTPEDHLARRDALDTSPAVSRALEIMTQPDRWAEAFNLRT